MGSPGCVPRKQHSATTYSLCEYGGVYSYISIIFAFT